MNWRTYVSATLGITGLIAAGVYLGGTNPKTGLPDPITVGGVTHTFTYTDENQKEDLIIYTDKESYTDGFSGATMYLAVVNESGVGQDIELNAYFTDSKRQMADVAVLSEVTTERLEPLFEEQCVEEKGTSTLCTPLQVGTSSIQEINNVWVPLEVKERTLAEILKENMLLGNRTEIERKTVSGKEALRKSSPFFVPAGSVIYYRVKVTFPPQERTEMSIEAVGSQGGYGIIF